MAHSMQGFDRAEPSTGESLPITVSLSTSRGKALTGIIGAVMIAGASVYFFTAEEMATVFDRQPQYRLLAFAILGIFLLRFVWWGTRSFGRSAEATIDEDTIHYCEGRKRWSEPLANYEAIRWRQEHLINQSENTQSSSATTYQIIEAEHRDPARSLLIFRDISPEPNTRATFERLARATGLPAVDARKVTEVVREAGDLDKSIKELAAEGKIDTAWDNEARPARFGLSREGEGDAQVMTLTLPPPIPLLAWRLMQAVCAALVIVGLVQFSILLIICSALPIWGLEYARKRDLEHPRTLRITRSELTYSEPARTSGGFTMKLPDIEELQVMRVAIGKAEGNRAFVDFINRTFSSRQLVLVTDQEEQSISGLQADELRWLEKFLRAAVANA
ncbi:hypothetical protein FV139_00295 [Parahaliea maris]|uniref:Uncharacterized protein n=1 Tax=Parahaliea maris TaxID=2716870 RepID=A0A5C9A5C8_9GAMM|nr:hypothetical protein [Parahaliea maris]TXS95988.1 hypothetical protein FV139_00295 [Parahaliea maris]